jgi:Putative phage abortive infection protein
MGVRAMGWAKLPGKALNRCKAFVHAYSGIALVALALLAAVVAIWFWWATHGIHWIAGLLRAKAPASAAPTQLGELGQAGDVFGGVNALFAAFAFVGVGLAAFFQYRTFTLIEEQQKQQRFEPLFFELLKLTHEKIPNKLLSTLKGQEGLGAPQKVVEDLYDVLILKCTSGKVPQALTVDRQVLNACLVFIYGPLYQRNEESLGPYFRSINLLLKRIHTSRLPLEERLGYVELVQIAIPEPMCLLLLLHMLIASNDEFSSLAQGYGLLKNLAINRIGVEGAQRLTGTCARAFADERNMHAIHLGTEDRYRYWRDNPDAVPEGFDDMYAIARHVKDPPEIL